MATRKIPILDASAKQLRDFATGTLGLDVAPTSNRDTLIAKIKAAHDGDEITMVDELEEQLPEVQTRKPPQESVAKGAAKTRKYADILLTASDEKGGDQPIPVGVNGAQMLIPRGKRCQIPIEYYHVLSNAVGARYDTDSDGRIIPEPRMVTVFPMTVYGFIDKPIVAGVQTKVA